MSLNQTASRDAKILQWQESVKALAAAKDAEAALRREVLTDCFGFDPDALREGTENVELGNGYKLKAVFKISRNLNNENDAVDKVLSKIEKTGPEGQFVAERLVKWKPELSISEYKKLPEKFRKMIDEVVTSKEATPSVELVEPKSK